MGSHTEGLDRWDGKIKSYPRKAWERMLAAQVKKAELFAGAVRPIIPNEHGKLLSTLKEEEEPAGASVSIGGPEAPYPAHVELGHMAPGGVHVRGHAFWWTTRRVLAKKFRAIDSAASRQAAADISSGG